MKNRVFFLFFIAWMQIVCIHANSIDLLREKFQAEQLSFISADLHDKEFVKNMLSSMYQIDQELRKEFIHDRANLEMQTIMHEMDQFHTGTIKAILAVHGWMTISQFGAEADNQAWLLVQHADHDRDFQEQILIKLTDLQQKGETNPRNYAYLYDRVALNSEKFGMKQKYGTQLSISAEGEFSLGLHDGSLQELNICRQQVGLGLIEDYIEQIKIMYKK